MSDALLETLSKLASEERNPDTMELDTLSSIELVTAINEQDRQVPLAIEKELPQIAKAVDVISTAFYNGGRLLYTGAGTSGRLGALDASECPPTFGVAEDMVVGLIAGGNDAVFRSIEHAEDSTEAGKLDLIESALTDKDVVVGIAASGRTPYVTGALKYATTIGAQTIALTCNADSEISKMSDITIAPVVGPEVLTGSTRLKSGTAQKLVLNMLTTASMVKIGKCYQNLMVDVKVSNEKLAARAIRIVMQATGCTRQTATDVLEQSQYDVKAAILMQLSSVSFAQARRILDEASGHLRAAIEQSAS